MAIEEFQGSYRFLSNFWPASVEYDGVTYPTVEHAFQAAKTLNKEERNKFQNITAAQAKKLGRTVTLRSDWEEVKVSIMKELLEKKFSHSKLRDKLSQTKPHKLIEGNYWNDTFWGVCRGVGKNTLGELIMEIRETL